EGWVPYEEIDPSLAEANASLCLGYENLESRFAFRTRYVDLFRARVPLVCTRGDVLAERVEDEPLGITVPERDVDAVVAAIERILDDHEFVATAKEGLSDAGGTPPPAGLHPRRLVLRDEEDLPEPAVARVVGNHGGTEVTELSRDHGGRQAVDESDEGERAGPQRPG
ncbi:MAG TPA: hypothetical protein PKD27_10750, partial [Tepidiformaceae bacterium]|nr:hypothetical protein [Tepidiformaceae bacterium]